MQDLQQTIKQDMILAMKAKKSLELSVLRMLLTAIKNKEISLGANAVLTDEQVLAVVKSEVKKRKDSVTEYNQGNRPDLAEQEEAEIVILDKYLPAQLSEDEVVQVVQSIIDGRDEASMKDFGDIMSQAMAQLQGNADGAQVSAIVKKLLAK